MYAKKHYDGVSLTKEGDKFFKKTFGFSIRKVVDPMLTLLSNKNPVLDILALDDILTERHPEHTDKLSMAEILEKEYGKEAMEFVQFWMI